MKDADLRSQYVQIEKYRSSCFAFDCVAPKFSPPVFAGLKQSASRHPLVGDPELWRCDQKPGRAGAYVEGKKFLHIEIFLKVSDISQGQHICGW